jgi:predicted anti-sigma-YlaC factor YlaD
MKTDCTQARHLMAAELDGDLASIKRPDLDRHLALCAPCRQELDRLRRSVAVLEALPRPEPSPAFVATTLRRARLARQAQQVREQRLARFGSLAALALGALALAAVRASGLWKLLAEWLLSFAPGVIRLGDRLAVGVRSVVDIFAPFVRGLFLALADTLDPFLTILAHAGRSAWNSALPGYVLAILTLSLLAALSLSRAAAGPVQVEKMP